LEISRRDRSALLGLLLLLGQLSRLGLKMLEPPLELRHKLVGWVLRLGLDF
jgi:hypothetical protein